MENEIVIAEKISALSLDLKNVIEQNRSLLSRAESSGRELLHELQNSVMNDDLDAKAKDYVAKSNQAIIIMENRRKPTTQLFDIIRSQFTLLEKQNSPKTSGSLAFQVQKHRDDYACKKIEDQRRQQAESARLAAIETSKEKYRIDIESELRVYFMNYMDSVISEIEQQFTGVSPESATRVESLLKESLKSIYPANHFASFNPHTPAPLNLDEYSSSMIRAKVVEGKYDSFCEEYRFNIDPLVTDCLCKLPSRIEELKRSSMAKSAEEAEASQRAIKERDEKEQAQRELEKRQKAEEERRKEETARQQSNISVLFAASAVTGVTSPITAKVSKKIRVTHPAAFMEIMSMWWLKEGINLSIDELNKIFKKQVTFCEKVATKEDELIKSRYIVYEEDIKSK